MLLFVGNNQKQQAPIYSVSSFDGIAGLFSLTAIWGFAPASARAMHEHRATPVA